MNRKAKKEKKEKIVYVDDGRTVADMSGVRGSFDFLQKGTVSPVRDIWHTFWMAFRMMLRPTLVAVGFLCVIFGIAWIVFRVI